MRLIPIPVLLAILATFAPAQFLTEVRPAPNRSWTGPPVRNLQLAEHLIETEIASGVARSVVTLAFANPHGTDLEGTFLFPLPRGAVVRDFEMMMGGKMVRGEVLEKDKARAIYTGIVQRAKDPALLEFVGDRVFRARVFPVPARGEARIRLSYAEVLRKDATTFELRHPFRSARTTRLPVGRASVQVKISSDAGKVMTVYSPSHQVKVVKEGDREATVTYEAKGDPGDRDFVLVHGLSSKGGLGATFLTHAEKPGEGAFLLMLAPSMEQRVARQPKDVLFVVDTSGSMRGRKIEQTKEALRYCVNGLGPDDRFNVVSFSTEVRALRNGLIASGEEERKEALAFVDGLEARGGTNIHEALLTAFGQGREGKRPLMIIFLTDGTPTVGETRRDAILAAVQKANQERIRLFVFGVGDQLNVELLDLLAENNRGARDYVAENEDIEVRISSLFTKVSEPVMTGLKLAIEGIETEAVHPRELTDLFRGEQLLVAGRYRGEGAAVVRLTGQINGEEKSFVFEPQLTAAADNEKTDYVPALWAARRVGFLMDQIRLNGRSDELEKEVVRLGKSYGVLTPYTSYLVVEDEPVAGGPGGSRGRWAGARGGRRGGRPVPPGGGPAGGGGGAYRGPIGGGTTGGGGAGGAPPAPTGPTFGGGLPGAGDRAGAERQRVGPTSGEGQRRLRLIDGLVQGQNRVQGKQKQGGRPDAEEADDQDAFLGESARSTLGRELLKRRFSDNSITLSTTLDELRRARVTGSNPGAEFVKRIGQRTFVRRPGLWVDAKVLEVPEEKLSARLQRVVAFSEAWTALLAKHADLTKVLALGDSLIFVLGDQVVQIVPAQQSGPEANPRVPETGNDPAPGSRPAGGEPSTRPGSGGAPAPAPAPPVKPGGGGGR